MRIAILGAGAIGCYLAARLAVSGVDVVLVARGAALAAIRARGLTVTGERPVTVGAAVAGGADEAGPCDLVISCVKAHGLPAAAPEIMRLAGHNGWWVPVVNGIPWWYGQGAAGALAGIGLESVDPGGRIATAVAASGVAVVGAVAFLRSTSVEAGVVEFTGGPGLVIGMPDGSRPDLVDALAASLSAAGVPTRPADDIRAAVWQKLPSNVALNPLSAITGLTVDRMLADPECRQLLASVGRETMELAALAGFPPKDDVEDRLRQMATLGAFRTSMLQDADAGRPLELAAVIDAVVEVADRLSMPVPATRHLAARARDFAVSRGLQA